MSTILGIYSSSGVRHAKQFPLTGYSELFKSDGLSLWHICNKEEKDLLSLESERFRIQIFGRVYSNTFEAFLRDQFLSDGFWDQLISHLNSGFVKGEYIFLSYDKLRNRIVCVRDQLGVLPFYYCQKDNVLIFSNDPGAVRRICPGDCTLDNQWLEDSLISVFSEKWRTPYKEIQRLEPGHYLKFDSSFEKKRYWDPGSHIKPSLLSFGDATDKFKALLHNSISERISECSDLGCELSGGLDSSGVTSFASRVIKPGKQKISAFSQVFSDHSLGNYEPYVDESRFSKMLIETTGIERHFLCNADNLGVLETLKKDIIVQDGPVQQGYHVFSDVIYDRAEKAGIQRLISGFGGDEGISSSSIVLWKELYYDRKWSILRRELKAYYSRRIPGSVKDKLVTLVFKGMPVSSMLIHNFLSRFSRSSPPYPASCIPQGIALNPERRSRYDLMMRRPEFTRVLEKQIYQLSHNHIPQRMEYSYHAANARNITYSYPLLDTDLLCFYLGLPSTYKFHNGFNRAVYRESLTGLVPDGIRLRTDKSGATIPTVFQRYIQDMPQIKDLILRSKTYNKFHYVDYDCLLSWLMQIDSRAPDRRNPVKMGSMLSCLNILLLQDMERNGEFSSGIRC